MRAPARPERQHFIGGDVRPPKEMALDIDATRVPPHGAKGMTHLHRYHDSDCHLLWYAFSGQELLGHRALDGVKQRGRSDFLSVTPQCMPIRPSAARGVGQAGGAG